MKARDERRRPPSAAGHGGAGQRPAEELPRHRAPQDDRTPEQITSGDEKIELR